MEYNGKKLARYATINGVPFELIWYKRKDGTYQCSSYRLGTHTIERMLGIDEAAKSASQ